MLKTLALAACLALAGVMTSACSTAPDTKEGRTEIRQDASQAASMARNQDSGVDECLDTAYAYAVFPKVGKGAAGVGGAYGKGVVYRNGKPIGYCDVSQASIGLQLGAQSYTEILCFEDERALQNFMDGKLVFDARATAVAMESGTGFNPNYRDGVLVFTTDEKGLMAEASVGGQKFTYEAI